MQTIGRKHAKKVDDGNVKRDYSCLPHDEGYSSRSAVTFLVMTAKSKILSLIHI